MSCQCRRLKYTKYWVVTLCSAFWRLKYIKYCICYFMISPYLSVKSTTSIEGWNIQNNGPATILSTLISEWSLLPVQKAEIYTSYCHCYYKWGCQCMISLHLWLKSTTSVGGWNIQNLLLITLWSSLICYSMTDPHQLQVRSNTSVGNWNIQTN